MRKVSVFFILLTAILSSAFLQNKKEKVVFFGDSITQAGVQPGGYIVQFGELVKKAGRANDFDLVGAGIGGNKVYDLYLRMDEDVLAANPQTVVIYIGVNDVWHKSSHGTGTDPDKFEKFYTAIIRKLKERNIKVILCTPAVIGERTDHSNSQDGDLNQYSNIIRKLASANNLKLVDLRKAFLDYNLANNLENKESGILTTDRVHLNDKGNALVAEKMWAVLQQP